MINLDKNLVNLFNAPGPYYSSYPTLNNWKDSQKIKHFNYLSLLKDYFLKKKNEPIYLYIHIPYCAKLCYYCACNIHISNNRDRINVFVKALLKEIEIYKSFFSENDIKPNIKEIHLGGGTPSHLTTQELTEIVRSLKDFVDIKNLKEFAMEIDPRTVDENHFDHYSELGIDRISFGVQDFNDKVQEKINRVQPFSLVKKLMDSHLKKKFKGVNFDLLYGLPSQTLNSFKKTVELTNELKPERITLIKYAHIPNKRKHMKMIKYEDLPQEELLPEMFVNSTKYFIEKGYEWVGIDHFALKNDELAIAKKNKNVKRNFGGETPGFSNDIIGFGPTSTSAFGNIYSQSTYDLKDYINSVNSNNLPIAKYYELNEDDEIRRYCNFEIQCNQYLSFQKVTSKYGIDFKKYFIKELEKLKKYEKQDFIKVNDEEIKVTDKGRFFVRHICKEFDTFLQNEEKYEIHGP